MREIGWVRHYGKPVWPRIIRVHYHGSKEIPSGTCHEILKAAGLKAQMIDSSYALTIDSFFGFCSTELEGFNGVAHSVEDCLYQANWGMIEHLDLLRERRPPISPANPNPRVIIENALRRTAA